MKSVEKIIAVTGARSEYDLLSEVYSRLHSDPEIDFGLIVTGSHLSEKFGKTIEFIEKDGFNIVEEIHNLDDSNDKIGRILSLGNQINPLATALSREKPDIVLIAGDREEAISVTLVCGFLSIPCAHFFGGDIAKDGNIDNSIRYAASKFASIHFPTLEKHKENLLKLGEDEWRIHVVGNPALDRFLKVEQLSKQEVMNTLQFNQECDDYFVLIQHSIISEVEKQENHIRITLDAILQSGKKCFINYPNSDPGNEAIIQAYLYYVEKHPDVFYLFQNLDRKSYTGLLNHASCLLGNSSSGIVEVASLGLAAINIGSRQRDRLANENVIFVNNDKLEILYAIDTVLNDAEFKRLVGLRKNIYGDGNSTEKIIQVLKSLRITDELVYKNITYT